MYRYQKKIYFPFGQIDVPAVGYKYLLGTLIGLYW